jgi:hypothetical protein
MGDVARTLIGALNAELSARYPEPGATHFNLDPREVAPGSARTLPKRRLHEHSTLRRVRRVDGCKRLPVKRTLEIEMLVQRRS